MGASISGSSPGRRRRARHLLLGLAVAGILGSLPSGCSPSTGAQAESAPSTETWVLDVHPRWKTVSFALPRGADVDLGSGAPAEAILAYLATYRETFGMADPPSEWRLRTTVTADGFTTYRYQQIAAGLTVDGSEWVANLDKEGKLASFSGTYVPGLSSVAALSASAATEARAKAQATALKDVTERLGVPSSAVGLTVASSPTIAVLGAAPRVVFHISTHVLTSVVGEESDYEIDAASGAIAARRDLSASDVYAMTGSGYGAAHYPPYNQSTSPVRFPIEAKGATFLLDGTTKANVEVETFALTSNGTSVAEITSSSPDPFTDSVVPAGADLDAQATMAEVIDAYHDTFGRTSFDNAGAGVPVYIGDPRPSGALWVLPGAGAPCTKGIFTVSVPLVIHGVTFLPGGSSFDLFAHEFTHGVSACSWGGGVSGQESKAVDEGMSDVLGEIVAGGHGAGMPTTWGRGLDPEGSGYFRNLGDPHDTKQLEGDAPHCASMEELPSCATLGTTTSEPHFEGTILDYAWYLMTFGGTHVGNGDKVICPLGWKSSADLWYRIETQELHQAPSFRDAAMASLSAGKKLNLNLTPIACAWKAVRVLTAADVANLNVDCATGNGSSSDGGAESERTDASTASGTSDAAATDGGSALTTSAGPLLLCRGGSLLK